MFSEEEIKAARGLCVIDYALEAGAWTDKVALKLAQAVLREAESQAKPDVITSCIRCGWPTMHMGPLCYACGQGPKDVCESLGVRHNHSAGTMYCPLCGPDSTP